LFETYKWFSNSGERNRSGVINFDMGLHFTNPEIVNFSRKRNLPTQHGWHIHTYFNTYRVKLRKTGEWITLIDRGRLTALDHVEVRDLASRHGDPNALLSEDWVPAFRVSMIREIICVTTTMIRPVGSGRNWRGGFP
jgi:hypothetical protein